MTIENLVALEYVQFQGISVVSKIISKFTRDEDTHSAVIDREHPGTDILIEQWPHKGRIKSWMDYGDFNRHTPGTRYNIWKLLVTRSQYDEIMGVYRHSAAIKKPYDWQGIFNFVLRGKDNESMTFCSEELVTPLAVVLSWTTVKPFVVYPGFFRMLIQAAGAQISFQGKVP
jgi:hypothetical protein